MKLWKVWRTDGVGYDEYDSAVVAAETVKEAWLLSPWRLEYDAELHGHFKIDCIGTAAPGVVAGSVVESFNAG